jgi:hypothetical protein
MSGFVLNRGFILWQLEEGLAAALKRGKRPAGALRVVSVVRFAGDKIIELFITS